RVFKLTCVVDEHVAYRRGSLLTATLRRDRDLLLGDPALIPPDGDDALALRTEIRPRIKHQEEHLTLRTHEQVHHPGDHLALRRYDPPAQHPPGRDPVAYKLRRGLRCGVAVRLIRLARAERHLGKLAHCAAHHDLCLRHHPRVRRGISRAGLRRVIPPAPGEQHTERDPQPSNQSITTIRHMHDNSRPLPEALSESTRLYFVCACVEPARFGPENIEVLKA